ncbi:MAG: EAL domain-containing protein [bacterium]|nr:EAL domain-containing protein [bacterium]
MSEPVRVLLVENDEAHAELLVRAFEAHAPAMEVTRTGCLREARSAIADGAPDLLIADLLLPDGSGSELVPASAGGDLFPVVLLTSQGDERVAVEMIKSGAAHYIVKTASTLSEMPRTAERALSDWRRAGRHRRERRTLLESERRYRAFYDESPTMFFAVDSGGTVRSANRFAARQLGYSVDELIGKPLSDLHVEDERDPSRRHLASCFEQPEILHRWRTRQRRRHAGSISIRVTARIVRPSGGEPEALIVCQESPGPEAVSPAAETDDRKPEGNGRRERWVTRISSALAEDRFRLTYQPIAPIGEANGEGDHYELFLRMIGEDRRTVMPGAFLPAAERYNLAEKVDQWVITTAFEWLVSHQSRLDRLHLCSINLSGHSVGNRGFLDAIVGRFTETGIPPHKICFEITETAAIADLDAAGDFMRKLKNLGCRFALDDFGSGMRSFGHLKALPVDFIKIDGRFIRDILDDPVDLAVVKLINELVHVLGKKTIAESVETTGVLDKLTELGIDYAQGFGIGRPQSIAEMA